MNIQVDNAVLQQQKKKTYLYEWYVVGLCMVAYIFSFVDRQILALMIEPIKADLQISCLLYTSPSPRDGLLSRMPSSA